MRSIYHLNFLGLPPTERDPAKCRVAILPVPYEATCSYGSGTRNGPDAILKASYQVELYDPELDCEPASIGVCTLEPLEQVSTGPAEMAAAIQAAVEAILDAGKVPLLLGGEHSVSVGAVRAVAARERLGSILVIDAHADLRDSYQGSPYSHASAGKRFSELGRPMVQVGIRNISADEMHWYRNQQQVRIFWDHELAGRNDAEWIAEVVESLQSPVYLSLDLDGLDPAIMPATGTPEPGGLSWRQASRLIRAVGERHTISGADVVELEPIPGNHAPDFLAARLVFRLLAAIGSGD